MSTVTEEVKPEDGKPESEKKIFYCEVCKVPCMSSISLQSHYRGAKHRKKEKALRPKTVYLTFEPLSLFEPRIPENTHLHRGEWWCQSSTEGSAAG